MGKLWLRARQIVRVTCGHLETEHCDIGRRDDDVCWRNYGVGYYNDSDAGCVREADKNKRLARKTEQEALLEIATGEGRLYPDNR